MPGKKESFADSYIRESYFKLTAWGYPDRGYLFFKIAFLARGTLFAPRDFTNNPFEADVETSRADIQAAYRELLQLRSSKQEDLIKQFWLEESLMDSVFMNICWMDDIDQIKNALDNYVVKLSDAQKTLALEWQQDNWVEVDREISEQPVLSNEDIERAEAVMEKLRERLNQDTNRNLEAAVMADDLLSQIVGSKK